MVLVILYYKCNRQFAQTIQLVTFLFDEYFWQPCSEHPEGIFYNWIKLNKKQNFFSSSEKKWISGCGIEIHTGTLNRFYSELV